MFRNTLLTHDSPQGERMRKASGTVMLGLVVGFSVALVADRHATGQASPDDGASSDSSQGFDPFVLTDPGPGAIQYDQLTPEEQADVDAQAEASENSSGANVQTALANATAQEAARARAEIAARTIGMEGAGDEGVVP